MSSEIKLENIIKLFKRWAIEENQIQRSHLMKSNVMLRFEEVIKTGQTSYRFDYIFDDKPYNVHLINFYEYMNKLDVYSDFFAKCFDDFLMTRGIKDYFISELNNMMEFQTYNEGWPPNLRLSKKITTIEEYVKERGSSSFLSLVNNAFPWSRAKNKYINWKDICSQWRWYIVKRILT